MTCPEAVVASEGGAATLAERALGLVVSDPNRALVVAQEAVAQARAERDGSAGSTARRAAGLALRALGDMTGAEMRMRAAVRFAESRGLARAASEARMSLAFVLVERGRGRAALGQADRAASALSGVAAARLQSQRALVLVRAGRMDEALAAFAEALPQLRRHHDPLWEARALNNRGLLNVDRGSLTAARADLLRARSLHEQLGNEVSVAEVDWNLGFLASRAGDIVDALARYDSAEQAFARSGAVHPQLLLGRAEVLLAGGLVMDAHTAVCRALVSLEASGSGADRAEGLLLLAGTSLRLGDCPAAVEAADQARALFTAQHRPGWTLMSRLVGLRARERVGRAAPALVHEAMSCARDLAAAGWQSPELEARMTAALAARAAGRPGLARDQLELAAAARRSTSLDVRARAWHAEAQLRLDRGERLSAERALRAGLAAVRRRQSAVGATDLRVHAAAFGADLAALGLAIALDRGDAQSVLAWAELTRASTVALPPVRPPDEPEFAEALADMRRCSGDLSQALLAGSRASPEARHARAAEERVIRLNRTARGALHRAVDPPPTLADISRRLGDRVLVEYLESKGTLYAVTVRDARAHLTTVGPLADVLPLIDTVHFALRRMATGFGGSASGLDIAEVADREARELDRVLLGPLIREVADRPLVVVPTGAVHAVPWGLLPALHGRPFTVVPSTVAWLRADATPPPAQGRTAYVAGPGLPGADAEVSGLGAKDPRAVVLVGSDATVARTLVALDGADTVHIAAHGRLRTDNPLFSALELADGPLTVYDLEGLRRAPRRVLLPACQSGLPKVHTGDEVVGLVSALLALGARDVVAPVVPVSDAATATVMALVHGHLRLGQTPSVALAAVRLQAKTTDRVVWAAAAGFTAFGA